MASSEITIFLKSLAGETIIVEVDPYNKDISSFLRSVVKSEFPELQSVKFTRISMGEEDDEKDEKSSSPSNLRNPPLQNGEIVMFFVDDFENQIFKDIQSGKNDKDVDEIARKITEKIGEMEKSEQVKVIDNIVHIIHKNVPYRKQKGIIFDIQDRLSAMKYNRGIYPKNLYDLTVIAIDIAGMINQANEDNDLMPQPIDLIGIFNREIDKVIARATRRANEQELSYTKEEIAKDVASILLQKLLWWGNLERKFQRDMIDFYRYLLEEVDANPYAPIVGTPDWLSMTLGGKGIDTDTVFSFADAVEYLIENNKLSQESIETLKVIRDMIRKKSSLSSSFGRRRKSKKTPKKGKKSKKSRRSPKKSSPKKSKKSPKSGRSPKKSRSGKKSPKSKKSRRSPKTSSPKKGKKSPPKNKKSPKKRKSIKK